jgi:hypothetical protein
MTPITIYLFIHLFFAVILVGSNFFLEMSFNRRLKLVPPGSQAILSSAVGLDLAILNWTTLVGLSLTGVLLLNELRMLFNIFSPKFYEFSYGRTLLVSIVLTIAMLTNGGLMTFYYRPRLMRRLNPKSSETEVQRLMSEYSKLSKRLIYHIHFNFLASLLVLFLMYSLVRLGGII